jgi:predicted transcriptional regulator
MPREKRDSIARKVTFSVRLDPRTKQELDDMAWKRRTTMGMLAERLLVEGMAKLEAEESPA